MANRVQTLREGGDLFRNQSSPLLSEMTSLVEDVNTSNNNTHSFSPEIPTITFDAVDVDVEKPQSNVEIPLPVGQRLLWGFSI